MDDFSVKIESKAHHKRAKKAFKALGMKRLHGIPWSGHPPFPFYWCYFEKGSDNGVLWAKEILENTPEIPLSELEARAFPLGPVLKERTAEQAAEKYAIGVPLRNIICLSAVRKAAFVAGAEWAKKQEDNG